MSSACSARRAERAAACAAHLHCIGAAAGTRGGHSSRPACSGFCSACMKMARRVQRPSRVCDFPDENELGRRTGCTHFSLLSAPANSFQFALALRQSPPLAAFFSVLQFDRPSRMTTVASARFTLPCRAKNPVTEASTTARELSAARAPREPPGGSAEAGNPHVSTERAQKRCSHGSNGFASARPPQPLDVAGAAASSACVSACISASASEAVFTRRRHWKAGGGVASTFSPRAFPSE